MPPQLAEAVVRANVPRWEAPAATGKRTRRARAERAYVKLDAAMRTIEQSPQMSLNETKVSHDALVKVVKEAIALLAVVKD